MSAGAGGLWRSGRLVKDKGRDEADPGGAGTRVTPRVQDAGRLDGSDRHAGGVPRRVVRPPDTTTKSSRSCRRRRRNSAAARSSSTTWPSRRPSAPTPGSFHRARPHRPRRRPGGVAAQLLENTTADLRALVEDGGESLEALQQVGVLTYLEVRASPKELEAIRDRLMKVIKSSSRKEPKAGAASSPYRLTIAFFPLADGRRST